MLIFVAWIKYCGDTINTKIKMKKKKRKEERKKKVFVNVRLIGTIMK